MVSFLKKRRNQPLSPSLQGVRHSLSLPDLTTPLLDPASWEELPPFARLPTAGAGRSPPRITPPSEPEGVHSPSRLTPPNAPEGVTRLRAPSLVGGAQFHRPFTPWQIVRSASEYAISPNTDLRPSGIGTAGGFGPRWGRESQATEVSTRIMGARRRRGKGRVVEKLNVVVAGRKGVGKSSFIDLLLASLSSQQLATDTYPGLTPSSPTAPGPPQSALTPPTSPQSGPAPHAPPTPSPSPTTRLSARTILVDLPQYDKTLLRLIDTPGLEIHSDGTGPTVREKERERGVAGLIRLVEERFEGVLREESRIVRRRTGDEDDGVHLIIYLIDARAVLRPKAEAALSLDWSGVGLFEDKTAPSPVDSHPLRQVIATAKLSPIEITIIRRLSQRANVLPVLTQSDALTSSELELVTSAVRRDLAAASGPNDGNGFGIFGVRDEDDGRKTPTPERLRPGSNSSRPNTPTLKTYARPPTPASTSPSTVAPTLPFAIFAPEPEHPPGRLARSFPWGDADVLDPEQSDFIALRDAILDIHAKALRASTREVLYERYRTEKLLAKQAGRL